MKSIIGVATIIGTIIGAGILGLPYAISKVGVIPGLILMWLLSGCMTLLLLYLGEVVLRCKEVYQLPGLVKKYLGVNYYRIMIILFSLSIYGALISYVIGIISSVQTIISVNKALIGVIFTALISIPIIIGLKLLGRVQLIMVSVLIITLTIISLSLIPQISVNNLLKININDWAQPFGVTLFALTGFSVIPELEELLLKKEYLFKRVVIYSMIIVTIIYSLFVTTFIGVFGDNVKEIATESLRNNWLSNIIAIFGMSTSYLGLGTALSDFIINDLKQNKVVAWLITCLSPLIIALTTNTSFIQPIMLSGGYAITIIGLIIIKLWIKSKSDGKPAFTAPLGLTGATITAITLIITIIVTTINLIGPVA